ncbi:9,11-endoperoxide prostaglandin H2 reductase-like [Oppia nitens]|uniref:9,11-endoperoxide prostaglandin H2 reductase-like n=1 Tax=Oppia nitens TaxID=1686743 RepID=UPI0023DB3B3E|nr:9,11-endoperoxide prostaglandin H2 reductase-like [Oppia nitens]
MKLILLLILNCFYIITCAKDVPLIRLNTDKDVPAIGLGTWQTEGPEVVNAVMNALEAGYRHIDTAWFYHNEKDVGKGIQQAIDKGIVKREDIFITTKVWPRNMNRRKSLDIIKNSLKELNTSYVDLVLVHWPLGFARATAEVYKGLEDAYDKGWVRSLGVSNFKPAEIAELQKTAKVMPSMNQIRVHPGFNQNKTIDWCNKNNITVTGYSPLGTGAILRDPTLVKIGKAINKTTAQVAIRWQIQRQLVVIPKSTKKNRIIENFDVFDFELTDNQMRQINSIKQQNIRDFWG